MPRKWTPEFSFTTGAVRSKSIAYFILGKDDFSADNIPHAVLAGWTAPNNWGAEETDYRCPSVAVCDLPIQQGIYLGEWGEIVAVGSGDRHTETIGTPDAGPHTRGTLRQVRSIKGTAYACGMNRQVYRRAGRDKWVEIDKGTRLPEGNRKIFGFEAIDGFAEDDIYAVGWKGEIWHYNGKRWKQIDSPTNVILTNVCCAPDGNVYAIGRLGTLLRGRGNVWERVEFEQPHIDFWGIAWFNDRLYVSTMKTVHYLEKDALELVKFDFEVPATCYHLSAADGMLWSIGLKDVMAFDGSGWFRVD